MGDENTSVNSYETIEEEVTVSTYEEQEVSDDESWETLDDLDLSSVYTTDEEEIEWSEYETASESDDGPDIVVVSGNKDVVKARKKPEEKSDGSGKGTKPLGKMKKPSTSAPPSKGKTGSKSPSKNKKDVKALKGKMPSSDKRQEEDDKDKDEQEKDDDEDESESSSGGNESDDDSDIPPPVKYGKCKKLPKDTPIIHPKDDPVYNQPERMKWSTKDYCPGFKTKEELFPHRYKNKKKTAATGETKTKEAMKQKEKKMRRVVHKEIVKTRRKVERKEPQKVRKKKEKPPKIIRVRKEKKIIRKNRVKKERVNFGSKPLHSERAVSNTSNSKASRDNSDGRIVQCKESPVTATIDLKSPASKGSTTTGDLKKTKTTAQTKGESESSPKKSSQLDADVEKQIEAALPGNERKNDDEKPLELTEEQKNMKKQKNMKQSPDAASLQNNKKDDDESRKQNKNMKQTLQETPPRNFRKKDDEKKVRKLSEERKRKCYMWYARLGQPHRAKMKQRVMALHACDITPEEVDLLPWVAGGTMLSVKEMNKLFLDRSTDTVTYKYEG